MIRKVAPKVVIVAPEDEEEEEEQEEQEDEDSLYDAGDDDDEPLEAAAAAAVVDELAVSLQQQKRRDTKWSRTRQYELSEKDRVLYRLTGDKQTRVDSDESGRVKLYNVSTQLLRICADNNVGCIFTVPAQANVMNVPKRRIHDVVCVFRAVGLVDRASIVPGQIRWLGYEAMQAYLRDSIVPIELKRHASDLYALSSRLTTEAVTAFVASCVINKRFAIDDLPKQIVPIITDIMLSVAGEGETVARIQKSCKGLMRRVYDSIAVLSGVGRALFVPAPPPSAVAVAAPLVAPRPPPTSRADMLRQQRDAYNIQKRVERDKQRKAVEEEAARKKRQLEEEERACNGTCRCCVAQRALREKGRNRATKKSKVVMRGEDEESTNSFNHSLSSFDALPLPPPPLAVVSSFPLLPMSGGGDGGEEEVTMHGFYVEGLFD